MVITLELGKGKYQHSQGCKSQETQRVKLLNAMAAQKFFVLHVPD